MKKILTLAAFVMLTTALTAAPAGPATSPKSTQPELKSAADSINYAVGLFYGEGLKELGEEYGLSIDHEKVFETIRRVVAGKSTDDYSQFNEFLYDYVYNRLPEQRLKEAEAFLEKLKAENPDVKTTESGLVYQIFAPGDDRHAGEYDKVMVLYTKTFADGTPAHKSNMADSQNDADTVAMYRNNMIQGCAEGMALVGVGGKVKMWLHPDLASGAYYGSIPKNSLLVYEYEIVSIEHIEKPEVSESDYDDYYGSYIYDDYGDLIQYPASEGGYVWKMVKKAKAKTSYTDDDGNVWKKVKKDTKPAKKK